METSLWAHHCPTEEADVIVLLCCWRRGACPFSPPVSQQQPIRGPYCSTGDAGGCVYSTTDVAEVSECVCVCVCVRACVCMCVHACESRLGRGSLNQWCFLLYTHTYTYTHTHTDTAIHRTPTRLTMSSSSLPRAWKEDITFVVRSPPPTTGGTWTSQVWRCTCVWSWLMRI